MRKVVLLTGLLLLEICPVSSQKVNEWTLADCIEYAYKKNITIRKDELVIRNRELNAVQARAERYPSVGATINQNFYWSKDAGGGFGFSGSNTTNYSLSSSLTLFGASRITNSIKRANLDVQSGVLSLETARESVSLEILNAYLQVLFAEEQVDNSVRQLESIKAQVKLAEQRLSLKEISRADFAQINSQLSSEKLTLANSLSQLAIEKINLMQIMELPVTDSFKIAHPVLPALLNQERVPDANKIYETALSIKPQVKSASLNKEIAELSEKIARSAFYPVLAANAGIGTYYSGNVSGTYFGQTVDGLNPWAGFSLSIPVYQKKQVKTSVALAKIGIEEAGLSETNTRNELRKKIEQACQDVLSAQVEYEASLESYNAYLASSSLSDEKFRQGMINPVEYLVSRTNLITSESQLLQSKYKLIFIYKILDFYSGAPLVF
ncbi:MAG: TolC family protein [Bacteroidales bacterium]